MGGRRAASPPSRTTQRNPRVRSISRAPMPGGHARCRSSFSRRQASSWRVMPERLLCGPSGRAWSTPADSLCAGDRRSIAGGPAACALRRVSRSGLMCMEEARGACRGAHYIGLWPSDVVVCVHALVTYLSHTLPVLVWTALRHL